MQKLLALVAAVLFTLGVVAGCGHNGGAATAQVGKTPVQTDKTCGRYCGRRGRPLYG
jgi:hypothetical protein